MSAQKFEIFQDDDDQQKPDRATGLLLLMLQTMAQRTIMALESCFTLITCALMFWASMSVIQNPNTNQLIGLAIFAVFILIANWLVLRRRKI